MSERQLELEPIAQSPGLKDSAPPPPPNVLLVSTTMWISAARLAMALRESGFRVEIVCRKDHPVLRTHVIERWLEFKPMRSLYSVEKAILYADPDLIVSCDESALALLHHIHSRAAENQEHGAKLRALIERSVGNPTRFHTALARSGLMELAEQEGIGIPTTRIVTGPNELPECIEKLGLPLVLKSDASAGGTGVRVVRDLATAKKMWRRLHGPPGLLRTINRMLLDRDWTPILPYLRKETRVVSAQKYIRNGMAPGEQAEERGQESNMVAVCWHGEVLACICMEVVQTWRENGPSSVLRVIEQEEMVAAARKIARRLEFSGFCGFDFIYDPVTRRPLLLEMNARPTQISHLALGPGLDLTSALYSALMGAPLQERPAITHKDLIALFPQEWQRDPASAMLRSAYHDVPRAEKELVRFGYRVRPNRRCGRPRKIMQRMWAFYTGSDLH